MEFPEGKIVRLLDSGDEGELVGRICSVEAFGCWVYFEIAGCLFVPMDSLEVAEDDVGDAPLCPRDCPPNS